MKRKIKLLVTILVSSFLASSSISVQEQNIVYAMENIISVDDIDVSFCMKQNESIEKYQKMISEFNINNRARGSAIQYYDDSYGGAYINQKGELIVLVRDNKESSINFVKEYAYDNDITIEKCTYSYNQLLEVIQTINSNLDELMQSDIIISEIYEDVYSNSVKIGVHDLDKKKEKVIRSIIDKPYMDIFEKQISAKKCVDVKGGDFIVSSMDNGGSTVGFCATKGNIEGMVISGHAGNVLYENFTTSGTTIGYVTDTAYYNNTTADAAFLTKSSYASVSSDIYLYKCHYLATSESDYPVGALVYKYGNSTGLTYGYIRNNYMTCIMSDDNNYVLSQVRTDMEADGGDSGGPVFMIKDVIDGKVTCKLLGIMCCIDNEYSYFSKYLNIVNELGVSAITQ